MNKQPCEQYIEWMSLAQDSMLNRTQVHLLHTHIAACPPCKTMWEAMTMVSQMFHQAPMAEPAQGFVERFEARLAYRAEQRRRVMIWMLLGIGVIALTLLALPSLIGALSFTGYLVLPYQIIVYIQRVLDWAYIVLTALMDAIWMLIRYTFTGPAGPVSLSLIVVAGALVATWTKFLIGRLVEQRTA